MAMAAVLIGFSSQEQTTLMMATCGYLVGAALLLTALARMAWPGGSGADVIFFLLCEY